MTGPFWLRVRIAGLAIASVVALLEPGRARANDFDQFQTARVAYESTNSDLAADLVEGLLDEATPGDARPLVLESRKYLAATYLFLGRRADAEQELEQLLRAEPDYVLDPLAFPAEFVKTFSEVKVRLEQERLRQEQERARAAAQEQARDERTDVERQQQVRRLVALAGTERVVELNSRWVALIPFGVGQFQNDHDSLGLTLAISEGLLLATAIASFAVHESLDGLVPAEERRSAAEAAEVSARYVNQISLGLLAAVAITGIIDAQVRFRPSRAFERPRPLPPDVRQLDVSVGPGSIGSTGRV